MRLPLPRFLQPAAAASALPAAPAFSAALFPSWFRPAWLMAGCAVMALAAPPTPGDFIVAALCVMPKRWEKDENLARLDQWARVAAARGAHLVITPECFLDGYAAKHTKRVAPGASPAASRAESGVEVEPPVSREQYLAAAEPADSPRLQRVRDLARELRIFLALGFTERRGEALFNSVLLVSPQGDPVLRYAKTHNPATHEVFNTLGQELSVVDTPHGRWGALICYDRQFPEAARILALRGADFILVPSFGGYSEINDALVRTRAYENGVWVAFVHPRRALIVAPDGKIVAQDQAAGDQLVLATITRDAPLRGGVIRDRRPEIYDSLGAPRL